MCLVYSFNFCYIRCNHADNKKLFRHMQQSTILKRMTEAAAEAGKILKKMYTDHSVLAVKKGGDYYDVVSAADLKSEECILKIFKKSLPDVSILSEEKGFIDHHSPDTIVIDPLDGSSNFLLGIPHFSVSMAYLHKDEIMASVVYNPITDRMYVAQKGKGVFVNKKKLKPVTEKKIQSVAVNFSHKSKWAEKRVFFDQAYAMGIPRVMNNWSPNLDFCLLAENKINAVVSIDSLIFDFAPGALIASESGCIESPKIKTNKIGVNETRKFVTADNKSLAAELYRLI